MNHAKIFSENWTKNFEFIRKKLSELLISIARWLTPSSKENVFEKKAGYEMKFCSCAISIDETYIRKIMLEEYIKPREKAIELAKKRKLVEAKRADLTTIEQAILETRTYLKDGYPIVEARVNCYVAKEK